MKLIAALVLTLCAFTVNAGSISVDYQVTNTGYTTITGLFSGDDSNNDGLLSFDELDNWYTTYSSGAIFANLNDLGDFDYTNNLWNSNATQWNQTTEDAYMTWNNWGSSLSTSNYAWSINTTVTNTASTSVPEPSSLLFLGLGLIGVWFSRKKITSH